MKTTYLVKQLAGTLAFFALIFLSAGTLIYWQGLTYVVIGLTMFIIGQTSLKPEVDLLNERNSPGGKPEQWDKIILLLSLLCTLSMYIIAGLDSGRFHWSPSFHPALVILGAFLTGGGQFVFLLAQKQNRYFSSIVRIQEERVHTVCDSGLYRFVRHPAYLGSILQALGFPLLMGSTWSIIPVSVLVILFITRTTLEDRFLHKALKNYSLYSEKTRYKLIPPIY